MRSILSSLAGVSAILSAVLLIGCAPGAGTVERRPPPNVFPGLNLSLNELKAGYQHTYAGKRLKPRNWPGGARVAVALSFDVDNASSVLARGTPGSEPMTRGQYGAVDGLPRILRVLDKENVPASFFIPAVSAALNPEMVPAIQSRKRLEIGIHGWIHENLVELNDQAREQQLLNQSLEFMTKVLGKKPAGYRAPSWAMSPYTMKQIKEAGFLYDSSLMASDDAYDILLDGQSTGVVELPIERILDDAPYFGAASGSLPSPELVEKIFRDEFDVAYQERGLFVLTMHPSYTGHRSRALWLDKLILYMKSKTGVWFATHEDIARYVKTAPTLD